jgi:diguanylate cyclase (GGDEF)-like protein
MFLICHHSAMVACAPGKRAGGAAVAGAKRFISVGVRLAVGTSLLVGLASTGAYVGLSQVARTALVTGKLESGRAVFSLFSQLVAAPLVFDDRKGLEEALGYLKKNGDVLYGRILDAPSSGHEATVLGEYRRTDFHEHLPLVLASGETVAERRVELIQDIRDHDGTVVGHATLVLSLEKELTAFEVRQQQVLLASIAVALALILLLMGMLRARVVRPLEQLTLAAQRLALGERVRLDVSETDEVGKLAGAFDRMAQTIREREQALATANDALTTLTLTDPLTGLKNRRFLEEAIGPLTAEVTRRYSRPPQADVVPMHDMVFVMIDLDHFKAVNDTHGHAAGDRVLMQMREILSHASRKSDMLVRWGGEEFLIVARSTLREHGHYLAERVRCAVRDHHFDLGDGNTLRATCSVGYATFPFLRDDPAAISWQHVVRIADRCLYAAKHGGRDRTIGITGSPTLPAAGLVTRIADDFDGLVAGGELPVTVFSGEQRGAEPPMPRNPAYRPVDKAD